MTLIRACEPLTESLGELAQRDPTCGWGRYAAMPPKTRVVTGNHMTLLSGPHVLSVAAALRADLDECDLETAEGERTNSLLDPPQQAIHIHEDQSQDDP